MYTGEFWYCFLTSRSFSFLRLNLPPSVFCAACFLTANLSLTFASTRQWSVSQSAPLKLRTSIMLECHLLSINMWSIWLWVCPSGEVQVYLWMFRFKNIIVVSRWFPFQFYRVFGVWCVLYSHTFAVMQRQQLVSPYYSVSDASVTIIAASVILFLATVLLTLLVLMPEKFLSSHDANMAALLGRTGLCMAQLQCALASLKKLGTNCISHLMYLNHITSVQSSDWLCGKHGAWVPSSLHQPSPLSNRLFYGHCDRSLQLLLVVCNEKFDWLVIASSLTCSLSVTHSHRHVVAELFGNSCNMKLGYRHGPASHLTHMQREFHLFHVHLSDALHTQHFLSPRFCLRLYKVSCQAPRIYQTQCSSFGYWLAVLNLSGVWQIGAMQILREQFLSFFSWGISNEFRTVLSYGLLKVLQHLVPLCAFSRVHSHNLLLSKPHVVMILNHTKQFFLLFTCGFIYFLCLYSLVLENYCHLYHATLW